MKAHIIVNKPKSEVWFVAPLKAGWGAAYRLLAQDGRPVVAELRVFHEWQPAPSPLALVGHGLLASLLNEVVVGRHVFEDFPRTLRAGLRGAKVLKYGEVNSRIVPLPMPREVALQLQSELLAGLGFDPTVRPRSRGPKGWQDVEYAELARDYLARKRGGSRSPVKDLAKAKGMSEVAARAALTRARRRGLLSRMKQGSAGGELTPLAVSLLRQTERKLAKPKRERSKARRTGGKRFA